MWRIMKNNKRVSKNIDVCFYEGYKGQETPRSVIINNKKYKIDKIIWRKRIQDKKSRETHEIFKCKIKGRLCKISVYEPGKFEITYL